MASHKHAPVPYTCGTINKVREFISRLEVYFKYIPEAEQAILSKKMSVALDEIEEIRYHNAELREWGCELFEEKEENNVVILNLSKRIVEMSELQNKIESLKESNNGLNDEILFLRNCNRELETQIKILKYELEKDKPF